MGRLPTRVRSRIHFVAPRQHSRPPSRAEPVHHITLCVGLRLAPVGRDLRRLHGWPFERRAGRSKRVWRPSEQFFVDYGLAYSDATYQSGVYASSMAGSTSS